MRRLGMFFVIATLALGVSTATAETSTSTLLAMVYVRQDTAVTVSADPLNFGTVNSDQNKSGQTTLHVTCSPGGRPYEIEADSGLHPDGTNRRMLALHGSDHMYYYLFTDTINLEYFGPGSGIPGIGTGSEQLFTIGAVVPNHSGIASDDYSDTVVITVTFTL